MNGKTIVGSVVFAIVFLVSAVVCVMWVYPIYNVYSSRKEGEAMLAHAQSSKEVAVAEAKAKMESAELLAKAEVIRAGGVAQANKIIGDSLKDNEAYLRYLWVNNLERVNDAQIIYIPTEAGMPIMEAGRRPKVQLEKK
jgi:regulator of protease activity HflC (stomatin/prohibitin superfamily)